MKRTINKKEKTKHSNGRRYAIGEHPVYDLAFADAANNSPVLNADKRHLGNEYMRGNPTSALHELEGDPNNDHYYFNGNDWHLGIIPSMKNELEEIHGRFKNWAQQQIKSGKVLKTPKKWPQPLLELRLKKEALIDVRRKEAKTIRKKIAVKEAEMEKERIGGILPHGPIGKRDGATAKEREELNSIDGQSIAYNIEGIPFINEPQSAYFGMSLYHYKQMSNEWMEEQGLTNEALFTERDELFQEEIKEALKKAESEDEVQPVQKIAIKSLRRQKLMEITEDDFPDWPDDVNPVNEL